LRQGLAQGSCCGGFSLREQKETTVTEGDDAMPERPNTQHALPRSRVVEVIERSTADALRQLRVAGIPETEALAIIQRFSVFSVQVLRKLDHLYREYEALLASDPDRSPTHQEWLDTKVGGMLLTIEAFFAALVVEAINKAKEDYRAELSRPREVIIPTPPPSPTIWEEAEQNLGLLLRNPVVVWLVSTAASFCLGFLLSGSTTWGLIAMGFTAFVVFIFEKAGLIFISIASGVCLLLWLLGGV